MTATSTQQEPLIKFIDQDHSYWHGKNKLISVSGLWKRYQQPFNAKHYGLCKVFEEIDINRAKEVFATYGKENPICVEILYKEYPHEDIAHMYNEVIMGWDEYGAERSERGTAYHSLRELRSYKQGYEINPYTGTKLAVRKYPKIYDNQTLTDNLFHLPDGCYPEMLIHNLEYGFCGQEDLVYLETIGGIRYCYSDDYKTDKKIKDAAYSKMSRRFQMLKRPFSHMQDSTLNIYTLKISTYSWMMEQFGYTIGGQRFTHIPNIETEEEFVYEVPYLKDEVERMLKHTFA